ncbi:methyltransferase domain-containing protein [Parvularcula lutaonensis]|uniref:Methyltransferase domain-containing protein n=1 Tax=Parvularcula lutaonensis TaxID=491923 RepID=A0ABV7M8E5_9PROT|nr:methyltransferase domain-containing protein [Parvularcula lutaonensis]GGY44547.1 hypothetical protein GCM10007148_11820 [Parvularcula lutaonensis]
MSEANARAAEAAGKSVVDEHIEADNARWSFGGSVPDHFEDHIGKSVPHYRAGHDMVAAISDFFIHEGSTAYEIGCSTAALCRRIAEQNEGRNFKIVGLEIEPNMVSVAKERTKDYANIEVRQADILSEELEPADLIVSYYTVQFIQPALRQQVIDKIYKSLNWGGAFIMFEKVRGPDARFQDMVSSLYVDFKLQNGFSEAEIVNKTRSLKGVLEPFSTQGNIDMMNRAGFVDIMTVFKHICFEGFVAIK